MRLPLLTLLLLPVFLCAQKHKSTHYTIITSSESAPQKEATRLSVSAKKMKEEKNKLLFEITIDGIRHENSSYDGYFSSFAPDSSINFTRSTTMVSHFLMLNRPVPFEVTGGYVRFKDSAGLAGAFKKQVADWNIKKDFEDQIVQAAFSKIKATAQQLFFPVAEATPHSSNIDNWLQSDASKMYKIIRKDKKTITLSLDSANTTNIAQVDRHTLQIWSATNDRSLKYMAGSVEKQVHIKDIILQMPAEPGAAIDSAYINMAVKGSHWSSTFDTGTKIDSVKVFNYIDWYGRKFADDRNFVIVKLDALQKINNYDRYRQELRKTAPRLLEGTHHVANRINDDNVSDNDFNELVPILTTERLYDWLQYSMSQVALRDVPKAKQATEKLVNNFSEKERKAALPLHLWVKASAYNNIDSTLACSSQLINLDNHYWNQGNGARYALLLYKMLADQKSPNAGDYLEKITNRLIPLYEDSLNNKRYLHKALLATAYYWRYKQLIQSDSAKAMALLQQAAFYSPQNAKEKAYGSFYDRVFLKSAESYSEEYLNKLTAAGRKDVALQQYIKEFLGNQGSSFKGLKSFYEKNYDAKNFGQFFRQDIIPQLQDAPEFELPDLNDESFSIARLRGRWTVLDFWGTWCGPCVEEMPKLNKYHNQLQKKAGSNIQFMTIACYDTKDKVVRFLAENKYNIPVLMSDGKVQNNYKVPGYPSKYIITPEGKMITTEFGFDWQSLVSELSQL